MFDAEEKAKFLARVEDLRLNPDALEQIKVHMPSGAYVALNEDGSRNSLQIFSEITSNDGFITPEGAEKGLKIFGEALREDRMNNPSKHPSVGVLEEIASGGKKVRSDVIRRDAYKLVPSHITEAIHSLKGQAQTPYIIYDEKGIMDTARGLKKAFDREMPKADFKNFYAVKAAPNPEILDLLRGERMGADCSSLPELAIADAVGLNGKDIMFTSNNTPAHELKRAKEMGAIINLDDITHIDFLERHAGLPELVCLRYNPGDRRVGNSIIGEPVEAKYGFTHDQIFEGIKMLKDKGVKRIGLHTMVASNERNPKYFVETAEMMFSLVREVRDRLGVSAEFLNLGGGLGTPYRPEQRAISPDEVARPIGKLYDKLTEDGLSPKVFMENGRFVTGPHGYLVTTVLHVMKKYKDYVGVDATMANLMRPGMYGSYHDITVLGKSGEIKGQVYDVVGSLCENTDKFAINRTLPKISPSDVLVIHNVGAHGHAMGYNYNGKLRSAEFMSNLFGQARMIRRPETTSDYFATLAGFDGSRFAKLANRN